MRPQGVVGALVAIAVGAILTYAVSFTMSGINIHIVGVIIMLAGVVALAILLVRSVSGLRRRELPSQPPTVPGPSLRAGYRQDSAGREVPPLAATRISTEDYTAPDPRVDQPRGYPESPRRPGTP
jgi:hypothetical protein